MASQVYTVDVVYNMFSSTSITAAAITALFSDYIVAGNSLNAGSKFRLTAYGKVTTAASSPGTFTLQAMWGGTGGTSLATSGALSFVASASNAPWRLEYLIVCTAIGSLFCQGWFWTTSAVLASPSNAAIPASGPAVTSGLTFSSSQNLDFNLTMSASTNTWVTDLVMLESVGV